MEKVALVTGATGGLGRALTQYIVARGWRVFAADCDTTALAQLPQHHSIKPVFLDVTKTASVEAAFVEIKQQVAQLDSVINFAGILRVGALVEIDEATLRQVLEINLMGTYRVNKTFFPLLRQGRIVNLSSETGWHSASPFNGPYAMSKYGIEAYSDALRRELSVYHIPVIKIQPGPFKTNMVAGTVDGFHHAAQTSELYGRQLEHFGELVREANKKAAAPEYLAEVIYRAITAKHPKANYSVKADPGRSFMEYLPIRVNDWIYKKLLRQKL
jgi:NAD(P)-dependent dehydrogenase (short-subunit alcohol dehydrogenase family)